MIRTLPWLLSIAALLLAVATPAYGYDPRLRWRTIQTEHFNIHYHDGETVLAYKGARVFEEVHAILTRDMERTLPRKRLDVVLTDHTDDANGYAISTPYPSIVLHVTAPMARQSLQGYDDWLWGIFVHEYTHILHIDTTEGINKVWRAMFGGWVKPNRILPGWMIEGYAVYNESLYTGGGRTRSAWAEMLVRMSVLDHRFPGIDRGDGYIDDWPGGHIRYIWGGHFHRWVAERHGAMAWTEMSHTHAAQLIPFVLPARKVFGQRFTAMWKDWHADLEVHYAGVHRELFEQGLTDEELLTEHPDFAQDPVVSPDGAWIYHGYRHERGPSALRRMRPDGSDGEVLTRHWSPEGITVAADGQTVYFAALRPFEIYHQRYDLYRFRADGERPWRRERLTHGARVRDPDLHPDGEQLVCVVNALGHNDLAIWTEADGLRRLTATQDYTQYARPRWSPDGRQIAVSAWLPGGFRDIVLFDADGTQRARLTADRAIDIEPSWSPDGAYVLFASDRTGIYNVFAYRLADGALLQVTNVIGGAFHPSVTPDGAWLVYEGYTSEGSDVRRAVYDPARWTPYDEPPPPPPASTLPMPPRVEQGHPSKRYNPLPTLLPPRTWKPIVEKHDSGFDTWDAWTLGGETGGRDVLRMHQWGAALSYRTDHRHVNGSFHYDYEGAHPDFRVGYYTYSLSRGRIWLDHDALGGGSVGAELDGVTQGDDTYLERRDRAYVRVNVPLHARHDVYATYEFDYHRPWSEVPDDAYLELLPGVGSYSNLEVGYKFRQTRSYRYSISPESGVQAGLSAKLIYPWLGAAAHDWTGAQIVQSRTVVTGEVRAYLSMPWWRNHVLALRAAGGHTFGVPLETGSFHLGGAYPEGSSLGSPSSGYPLRGYSTHRYSGDRLALFSAEYRLPLFFIERGIAALPLYVRGVHLSVAFDVGQVWRAGDYPGWADIGAGDASVGGVVDAWFGNLRPGMAVQFTAEIVPLWNGLLRLTAGYQQGLGRGGMEFGPDSFYAHVGTSF